MIKRLALLTLLAIPFLAHAQAPEDGAVAAKAPAQPFVTFDITGTFPANAPTRLLMAPGSSFLLEITFPQTVPADTVSTFALGADIVSGSYSFQGRTYPVLRGSYGVANHDFNYSGLTVTTPMGSVSFSTGGSTADLYPAHPVRLPVSVYQPVGTSDNPFPMGSVTFLPVDAGNQGSWPCTFTNRWGQSFTSSANVLDVTGRLVLPQPHPLGTR